MKTGALKFWRAAATSAALGLTACGQSAPSAPSGPVIQAGASNPYDGASGAALTALRLQHLKGYVIAAQYITEDDKQVEAGALVAQGLTDLYRGHEHDFGALDASVIEAASSGEGLNRAEMMQRLRSAQAAIEKADQGLEFDAADLAVRMVDLATREYQSATQATPMDKLAYSKSRGAAFAARDALVQAQDPLRRRNFLATSQALAELNTFADLWPSAAPPPEPATYAQVQTQGTQIRQTLRPLLASSRSAAAGSTAGWGMCASFFFNWPRNNR